jgi:serine/threonine protein kinase
MPREIAVKQGGQVKLHGFHMRRLANVPLTPSTKTQYFVAKLRYPAPEQIKGEGSDHRADIFSLGAILYELVCSSPPFGEPNIATVLVKIVAGQPDPLEKFIPDPPARLVLIVDKALAKKPADRYQTAADLALDLRELAKSL